MADIPSFRNELQSLIAKFEKDRNHYLSRGYPEAQVRIDFLDPLFEALGWDIQNKSQKPPHDRDVIVELSPETSKRPDYNFRINGTTKFIVEAKAPEEFEIFNASLKPNPKYPQERLFFDFKYSDYLDNIEKLCDLSRERVFVS